jgi:BON domain-containing protein
MKQRDEQHGRRLRGQPSRDTANPEPQWLRQDREQRDRERQWGDPARDYDYGSTWGARGGYDDHDDLDLGAGRNYAPFRVGTSTGLGGAPGYGSYYGSRSGWDLGTHQRDHAPAGPSFRGLGPQNYTRADERILDDIHERLTESHHVDARNILVDVRDGAVTLRGTVQQRRMRYAAEDLVAAVLGVTNIENQLKVQEEGAAPPATDEPERR